MWLLIKKYNDFPFSTDQNPPPVIHFVILHQCSMWKIFHLALLLAIYPFPGFWDVFQDLCLSSRAKISRTVCRALFSRKIREMEIGKLQLHLSVSGEIILDLWCMGKWFGWLARPDIVHVHARGAKAIQWPIPDHWGKSCLIREVSSSEGWVI